MDLAVPFALDDAGHPVSPDKGARGVSYRCPSPTCHTELRWRKEHLRLGCEVRPHFFHLADPEGWCEFQHEGESEIHCRAKLGIRDAVLAGRELVLERICPKCRRRSSVRMTPSPKVSGASCEQAIVIADRLFRLDVALQDSEGGVQIAIEVLHRHPVDAEKAAALSAGVPEWAEVSAEQFLWGGRLVISQGTVLQGVCRCQLKNDVQPLPDDTLSLFCSDPLVSMGVQGISKVPMRTATTVKDPPSEDDDIQGLLVEMFG